MDKKKKRKAPKGFSFLVGTCDVCDVATSEMGVRDNTNTASIGVVWIEVIDLDKTRLRSDLFAGLKPFVVFMVFNTMNTNGASITQGLDCVVEVECSHAVVVGGVDFSDGHDVSPFGRCFGTQDLVFLHVGNI